MTDRQIEKKFEQQERKIERLLTTITQQKETIAKLKNTQKKLCDWTTAHADTHKQLKAKLYRIEETADEALHQVG